MIFQKSDALAALERLSCLSGVILSLRILYRYRSIDKWLKVGESENESFVLTKLITGFSTCLSYGGLIGEISHMPQHRRASHKARLWRKGQKSLAETASR